MENVKERNLKKYFNMGSTIFLKKLRLENKNLTFIILLFLIYFILIVYTFDIFATNLEIIDSSTNKIIFSRKIFPGDSFETIYIHSVEKVPIKEVFIIDEEYRIILFETHFSCTGAGLPNQAYGNEQFSLQDGEFVIKNINRYLPFIPLRIGKDTGNIFIFKNEELDLSSLVGDKLVYILLNKK